jgi:hypothetical protein
VPMLNRGASFAVGTCTLMNPTSEQPIFGRFALSPLMGIMG